MLRRRVLGSLQRSLKVGGQSFWRKVRDVLKGVRGFWLGLFNPKKLEENNKRGRKDREGGGGLGGKDKSQNTTNSCYPIEV